MAGDERFNIRVYGIWIEADRVLVNEETIKGKKYLKFPGGGLELGESTINCLHREWKEELNLEIKVLEHFYTTDFYQKSAFDNSQVISIYYLITPLHPDPYIINTNPEEYTHWIKIEDITADTFTLPIDKVVAKMLVERFRGKTCSRLTSTPSYSHNSQSAAAWLYCAPVSFRQHIPVLRQKLCHGLLL